MSGAASLREIAASVRGGRRSATEVVQQTLTGIAAHNGAINAFTAVTGSARWARRRRWTPRLRRAAIPARWRARRSR